MNKENNKEIKRCFFCHKKLVNNRGVCGRCQLQGKDAGKKILGVGMVLGSSALIVVKALRQTKDNNVKDN